MVVEDIFGIWAEFDLLLDGPKLTSMSARLQAASLERLSRSCGVY
jgi:hypothetical protein